MVGQIFQALGSIPKLLEWVVAPRLWIIVFLICGILLLFPARLFPGLSPLVQKYRAGLEFAAVASAVICAVSLGEHIRKWIQQKMRQRRAVKRLIAQLSDLKIGEKHVLQRYLEQGMTVNWPLGEQAVASLVTRGILASAGGYMDAFRPPYKIHPDVWEYLRRDASIIGTPDDPRPKPSPHGWMR